MFGIMCLKIIIVLVVIVNNAFICYVIRSDHILKKSPTFRLLFTLFFCNIVSVCCRLVFDYPSEVYGKSIYGEPYKSILMVVSNGTWFAELFIWISVATSHLVAVFNPAIYYKLKSWNSITLASSCVFVGFLIGGLPTALPNMGFVFDETTFTWYENLEFSGMKVHIMINWGLQVVTFAVLLGTDIAIAWKILWYRLKGQHLSDANPENQARNSWKTPPSQSARLSLIELRLALNFLVLSSCLLAQTLIYNYASEWDSPIANVLLWLAPLIRGSKCWVYCISGSHLRMAISKAFHRYTKVGNINTITK